MDFFTNFVLYFGSGFVIGMVTGVYCVLDDQRIKLMYLRFVEEED